jgi:hypothetical protein
MEHRRMWPPLASLFLAAAASPPARLDTPLAAAEVLDPVGSDRKMPTDR